MRLIHIDDAEPGMILAKSIFREENGLILLKAYSALKNSYIEKIKNLDYEYIYILDSGETENDNILQPIKDETKLKAIKTLKITAEQVKNNEEFNVVEISEVITDIIDQILRSSEIVFNLIEISSHDNYTYLHSVNVTVLSLMTGSLMGLSRKDLEILGVGALMHDIGKTTIDGKILNKPAKLEADEFEILKEHSQKGYEILKKKYTKSYLPANVALQHHERIEGSGYPKGLTGDKIHRYAKIVAVADVFDAMTSDRVYRSAQPPYLGIREMIQNMNTKYDAEVVEYFSRIIAPYPTGTVLTMSNGDKALVTFVSRTKCLIKFVNGSYQGHTVNLYQLSDLKVAEAIQYRGK